MSDLFQQEYAKFKWQKWKYKSGNLRSLKHTTPPIPPRYGAYIIRAPHLICRVKDASDIVYIGQSGGLSRRGEQGIGPSTEGAVGRLFNTRGPDEWVREQIEELYPDEYFMVECYFTKNGEDPEDIETALLLAYLKVHLELPPANHKAKKLEP
jgi:hypothetical protein